MKESTEEKLKEIVLDQARQAEQDRIDAERYRTLRRRGYRVPHPGDFRCSTVDDALDVIIKMKAAMKHVDG